MKSTLENVFTALCPSNFFTILSYGYNAEIKISTKNRVSMDPFKKAMIILSFGRISP